MAAYVCDEDMRWALKSLIIMHVVKLFGFEEERLPIEDLSHISTEADLFFFRGPGFKEQGPSPQLMIETVKRGLFELSIARNVQPRFDCFGIFC